MSMSEPTDHSRLVTAHRGIPSRAPENTLAGIHLAADLGAQWVEIDAQLSKDQMPVVMHDETVDRCSDGSGFLRDFTLTELKGLDVGSWYSDEFKGEKIPTLEEALDRCKKYKLTLNLELKLYPDSDPLALAEKVTRTIREQHFPTDKLLFSSFSQEALRHCRRLAPKVRRGFLSEKIDFDLNKLMREVEPYSVHLDHRFLSKEKALTIKNTGAVLAIWTLNDPEKADYYYNLGVDNIITDKVDCF